jgi:hypothetical protein
MLQKLALLRFWQKEPKQEGDSRPLSEKAANLGFSLIFPPPVPFPQASISPTHAAPQHN